MRENRDDVSAHPYSHRQHIRRAARTGRQLNITVVPAYIQIEGQSLRDGEQITREEFYRRLPSLSKVPTTAVPSAYEFAAALRSLVGQADEVIAILLAGALSSMISVAELGAREVPELKVHFVDSQQLAMGIGWQVIMAAEAAARGASAAEIIAMLEDVRPRIRLLAVLDTVKYLVHSGRVSWAKGFAARLLDIKPLIEFRQGEAILVGQVRTRRRAMEQLLEMLTKLGPLERLAVVHSCAPDWEVFHARVQALFPDMEVPVSEIGPVIGTHIGPAALGVAVILGR